jgi:hypothetical protein
MSDFTPGLLTPEIPVIIINVSDRRIGDTIIKQRAIYLGLSENANPNTPGVVVNTEVRMYAADATAPDGYGPELTGEGFYPRPVPLVGNNDYLIDLTTGQVLAERRRQPKNGLPPHTEAEWQAEIRTFPQPCMLQGTQFAYARTYEQFNITDLVTRHMELANMPPFNRYA